MNKVAKIRNVFHELRREVGKHETSCEVLQCAHSLVELFSNDDSSCANVNLRTGGLPFENWSLNAAYSDGGWKILSYEMSLGTDLGEDEWECERSQMTQEPIKMEVYV